MARYVPGNPAPHRARLFLSDGVWRFVEEVRRRNGTYMTTGGIGTVEVVAAPGGSVTTSGTSLTLKSGLATTSQPHLATVQWRLALSNLPGLSLTVGKQHTVTVSASALPASTINSFFGCALVVPTGAWDAGSETLSAVSYGRGNVSLPAMRYAILTNTWSNLVADAAIVAGQMCYEEGSQQADIRALGTSSILGRTHQTTDTRTATYLYLVGFVQTAALLADATYTNPTVTISYGG